MMKIKTALFLATAALAVGGMTVQAKADSLGLEMSQSHSQKLNVSSTSYVTTFDFSAPNKLNLISGDTVNYNNLGLQEKVNGTTIKIGAGKGNEKVVVNPTNPDWWIHAVFVPDSGIPAASPSTPILYVGSKKLGIDLKSVKGEPNFVLPNESGKLYIVFVQGRDSSVEKFINPTSQTTSVIDSAQLEKRGWGVAFSPSKVLGPFTPASSSVYRLYNKNTGEHFYTTSLAEKNADVKAGWGFEGDGWTAPTAGTKVYRLYNPNAKGGDHYYTKSQYEGQQLVKSGWKWDNGGKAVFYSGGKKPVYVAYNPNAQSGAHNYTVNTAEQNGLLKAGWKFSSVAWYAQ